MIVKFYFKHRRSRGTEGRKYWLLLTHQPAGFLFGEIRVNGKKKTKGPFPE
jgi:hypothetical protein